MSSSSSSSSRFKLVYEDTRHPAVPRSAPFSNPWLSGAFKLPGLWDLLGFMWKTSSLEKRLLSGAVVDVKSTFPTVPLDAEKLRNPPADLVQCTWIGHASVLVQMDGVNILTDPVFAERAGPVQFAGPRRFVDVPFSLDELLAAIPIHAVCISHNHYDHLDFGVVDRLRDSVRWVVPTGIGGWLRDQQIALPNVVELDWWQAAQIESANPVKGACTVVDVRDGPGEHRKKGATLFACTPAQHWSARTPFDRFATLWGSWSILSHNRAVHFCGDTGHNAVLCGHDTFGTADARVLTSPDVQASAPPPAVESATYDERLLSSHFAEVGDVLGPFDLALIPIGAYEPRPLMRMQHIAPEEAVAAHVQLRAHRSLGVHWATFALTTEDVQEPPVRVNKEMRRLGLDPAAFFTVKHGETCVVGDGDNHNQVNVKRKVKRGER
jgi:N-acyl-phosphatidylethanolamine-hydrolysing phospholipase D